MDLWSVALFWEQNEVFQFQCFLPQSNTSPLKIKQNIFSALCAGSIFQAMD